MKVKNRKPLNMTALAANQSTPAEEAPAATAVAPEPEALNPRRPPPNRQHPRLAGRSFRLENVAAPRRDEGLGFARHAYLIAGLAAVAWAGALAAFVAGFQSRFGAFDYAPLQIAALLGLCILPAIFMGLAAFALRQGAQLAAETRAPAPWPTRWCCPSPWLRTTPEARPIPFAARSSASAPPPRPPARSCWPCAKWWGPKAWAWSPPPPKWNVPLAPWPPTSAGSARS